METGRRLSAVTRGSLMSTQVARLRAECAECATPKRLQILRAPEPGSKLSGHAVLRRFRGACSPPLPSVRGLPRGAWAGKPRAARLSRSPAGSRGRGWTGESSRGLDGLSGAVRRPKGVHPPNTDWNGNNAALPRGPAPRVGSGLPRRADTSKAPPPGAAPQSLRGGAGSVVTPRNPSLPNSRFSVKAAIHAPVNSHDLPRPTEKSPGFTDPSKCAFCFETWVKWALTEQSRRMMCCRG